MKASRFSDAQKAFVLKQGEEGTSVAEICRKAGISTGLEKPGRLRAKGGLNEHMGRHKSVTGPMSPYQRAEQGTRRGDLPAGICDQGAMGSAQTLCLTSSAQCTGFVRRPVCRRKRPNH
jgi:putative transposase